MRNVYSGIVDALLDADGGVRSGVVRFEAGKQRKQLVLRNGFVSFAESNVPDEHLARILMDMGCLQKEDLGRIAAAMKDGKSSDDAVLAVTGVSVSAIEEAVRGQAVAITASLLQHEGKEFRFYRFEACPHRRVQLQIPVRELLVEAARRAVRFRLLPDRYKELRGVISPLPPGAQDRLALPIDGNEAFAFSEVRHHTTIASFRAAFPNLGVAPEELLQRLLLVGLVRLESSDEHAPSASESADSDPLEYEVDDLLARFEGASHYEVLGVPPDATEEQIRNSYHGLARRYHPDRFQSSSHGDAFRESIDRLFARITGAYSALGEPAARSQYDDELKKQQDGRQPKVETGSGRGAEKKRMADALFRAGGGALAASDFEKAAELFRECVWLQPDVAKYLLGLGLAQLELPRRRKEAEQSLLDAIRLEPLLSAAHMALARLYVKVNLPRRAEARLVELLRWDPHNREAQSLLNTVAGQEG
jgi:DnaJ-domain-containing protein 1